MSEFPAELEEAFHILRAQRHWRQWALAEAQLSRRQVLAAPPRGICNNAACAQHRAWSQVIPRALAV